MKKQIKHLVIWHRDANNILHFGKSKTACGITWLDVVMKEKEIEKDTGFGLPFLWTIEDVDCEKCKKTRKYKKEISKVIAERLLR